MQRNQGAPNEKYREDSTRVIRVANADMAARGSLLYRSAPPTKSYESRIPLVDHADIVGAVCNDAPFAAPLSFHPEKFENFHVRGPTFAPAALDVGPRYAILHPTTHTVAPTLLAATRGYAAAAAGDATLSTTTNGSALPTTVDMSGSTLRAVRMGARETASAPEIFPPPHLTATGLRFADGSVASAGGRQSLATSKITGKQHLEGVIESHHDLSRTVGEQWGGARGDAVHDVVPLGRAAALAVPRDPFRGAERLGGFSHTAASGSENFHHTTIAGDGVGAPGAPLPDVKCVVHPLDAFPGLRRAVTEATVSASQAERFRRGVAGAQRRRDYLALARHPHGILGVDGPDNVASHVYGDVAARTAAAQEKAWGREAQREAHLMRSDSSIARRGYDHLVPGAAPIATLRLGETAASLANPTLAARDGGCHFLVKRGVSDGALANVDTRRVVGGGDDTQTKYSRKAYIKGETQGLKCNVITGLPL